MFGSWFIKIYYFLVAFIDLALADAKNWPFGLVNVNLRL